MLDIKKNIDKIPDKLFQRFQEHCIKTKTLNNFCYYLLESNHTHKKRKATKQTFSPLFSNLKAIQIQPVLSYFEVNIEYHVTFRVILLCLEIFTSHGRGVECKKHSTFL